MTPLADGPDKRPAALGPATSAPELDGQEWALRRRIEDVFAKLGEKFGDLTGRVEVTFRPETSFDQIGGLAEAKAIIRSFGTSLTDPELYRNWGITPPKGVLIYGPPGTGKSMLARALATEAGAIFYHLKLLNLTSKFGPNTGELLQEIMVFSCWGFIASPQMGDEVRGSRGPLCVCDDLSGCSSSAGR